MTQTWLTATALLLTVVFGACASAREEKTPDPTEYLIPPGARVEAAEYVDELVTGEAEDGALLLEGKPEFKTRVFGDELLRAPVTEKECLYYWLEVAYETEKVHYHLLTDISDNEVYVYLGGAYVEVDRARRAEGRPPDYVMTFKAGEEPANFPPPAHTYPEVTYRLWLLEPGREYNVRVFQYGSAYESAEDPDEIIYETYYHFFFE